MGSKKGRPPPPSAWKPGQSGNPKGRAPDPVNIAAREFRQAKVGPWANALYERLYHWSTGVGVEPDVALRATIYLIDCLHGRPKEQIEVTAPDGINLTLAAARTGLANALAPVVDGEPAQISDRSSTG